MIRLAVVFFLFALFMSAALASEQTGWVDQLKNQHGTVCCHNNDGRRLDDPEWRTLNGHYEVLFTEGWVIVPDQAVITMRNQDGIARVWSEKGADGKRTIRCFLAGAFG